MTTFVTDIALQRILGGAAVSVATFLYRTASVAGEGCVDLERPEDNGLQAKYSLGRPDNHQVVLVQIGAEVYALWFTDFLLRVGPLSALHIKPY